mgnify:CR=1 FL=1
MLYVLRRERKRLFVPSHVDDLLGLMNSVALWDEMIEGLTQKVTCSKVEHHKSQLGVR